MPISQILCEFYIHRMEWNSRNRERERIKRCRPRIWYSIGVENVLWTPRGLVLCAHCTSINSSALEHHNNSCKFDFSFSLFTSITWPYRHQMRFNPECVNMYIRITKSCVAALMRSEHRFNTRRQPNEQCIWPLNKRWP